jgi:surfactin synthase thioesterase subunit
MQLVLFHHAGGDKYAYQYFMQKINPNFEVLNTEFSGRNYRLKEPLYVNIKLIADDIYRQISPFLQNNYIFVGMSMGALVAFLVANKLHENRRTLPKHIFLASRKSIEQYKNTPLVADADDTVFWNYVKSFGANIDGILQHQELKEFYEPILRADFKALEDFNRRHDEFLNIKLPINATALIGKNDPHINEAGAQTWQKYFSPPFTVKSFDGGHFFLYNNDEAIEYVGGQW